MPKAALPGAANGDAIRRKVTIMVSAHRDATPAGRPLPAAAHIIAAVNRYADRAYGNGYRVAILPGSPGHLSLNISSAMPVLDPAAFRAVR